MYLVDPSCRDLVCLRRAGRGSLLVVLVFLGGIVPWSEIPSILSSEQGTSSKAPDFDYRLVGQSLAKPNSSVTQDLFISDLHQPPTAISALNDDADGVPDITTKSNRIPAIVTNMTGAAALICEGHDPNAFC